MAKFPDLTGDGEVTQADILKGRGVKSAKKGGLMKKKRYDEGGEIELESKMGRNENIGDDVRARAMAAMAAREAGEAEKKEAPKKAASKKEAVYRPKSLPESDREENSEFMRQFRKDEAAAKKSSFAGKTSPFAGKTSTFKKMASGGVTRADGCVMKGHTKGKMVKMNKGGRTC